MHTTPYNPAVERTLHTLIYKDDMAALQTYLNSLPNSTRRTAEALLAQIAGRELQDEALFALFAALCRWNAKAFTGRMLGAVVTAYGAGRAMPTRSAAFAQYAAQVVALGATVERNKCLRALLPQLQTPAEVSDLLGLFAVDAAQARVAQLLPHDTLPCAFTLFQSLRHMDHDRDFLVATSALLVRRGDRHAFNLAALIHAYFDLPPIAQRHYALTVKPYHLGYAESDYAHFCQMLDSI